MRCRTKICFFLLPLLLLLLRPGADSLGVECLDPSPTIQAGKNPYAPVNVRPLTQIEYEDVKRLLTALDGGWQGSAVDIYCRHIKNPENKEVNHYNAEAEIKVDYYGNFFIRVELYSPKKRITRQEVLRLYLKEKKLRVNSASAYGDVELISVSPTSIEFLYRLLLTTDDSKGTNRREFFVFLHRDEQGLTIRQQIYAQGRLSYEQHWQLTRR